MGALTRTYRKLDENAQEYHTINYCCCFSLKYLYLFTSNLNKLLPIHLTIFSYLLRPLWNSFVFNNHIWIIALNRLCNSSFAFISVLMKFFVAFLKFARFTVTCRGNRAYLFVLFYLVNATIIDQLLLLVAKAEREHPGNRRVLNLTCHYHHGDFSLTWPQIRIVWRTLVNSTNSTIASMRTKPMSPHTQQHTPPLWSQSIVPP